MSIATEPCQVVLHTSRRRVMVNWKVETPLREIFEEAVKGAASCWEHPERAGEYDEEKAQKIVNALMKAVNRKCIRIE